MLGREGGLRMTRRPQLAYLPFALAAGLLNSAAFHSSAGSY